MTNSHSHKEIGTEASIVLSILQIRSRHRLLRHLSMIIDSVISRNRIQTQMYLIPVFSQDNQKQCYTTWCYKLLHQAELGAKTFISTFEYGTQQYGYIYITKLSLKVLYK